MAELTPQQQQAMMEAFLAQESQGMWPTLPSIDEDWRDLQGDFFTTAKQGATLAADPSFLFTNNLLEPGAADPLTSFEPVDAPGWRQFTQWQNGNAYQAWVAGLMDAGLDSMSILTQLQQKVADPQSAEDEEIINWLPRGQFLDEVTGEYRQTAGPDMLAVRDQLTRLESARASDPQFVIGPDGTPVSVTTEDSPMAIKARALGYVNTPGQPYNPYSFAPEGVTAESDAALKQAAAAQAIPYATGLGVVNSASSKFEDLQARNEEAQRKWLQQMATTRAAMGDRGTTAALPGAQPVTGVGGGSVRGSSAPLVQGEDLNPGAPPNFTVNPSTGAIIYGPGRVAPPTTSGGVRATLDGGGDLTTNRPFLPANDLTVNPSTGGRTGTPQPGPGPRAPGDPLAGSVEWTDQYGGRGPLPDLGFGAGQTAGPPGARSGEGGYTDPRSQFVDMLDNESRGWSFGKGSPPPEPGPSRGWSLGKGSGPNGLNPPVGGGGGGGSSLFGNAFAQAVARNALAAQAEAARMALGTQERRFNKARQRSTSAIIANDRAREADRQRQAMVQQLTAQGRTPFGDEVQRRMAAIYGMGM